MSDQLPVSWNVFVHDVITGGMRCVHTVPARSRGEALHKGKRFIWKRYRENKTLQQFMQDSVDVIPALACTCYEFNADHAAWARAGYPTTEGALKAHRLSGNPARERPLSENIKIMLDNYARWTANYRKF